jgi:hypothetical protein
MIEMNNFYNAMPNNNIREIKIQGNPDSQSMLYDVQEIMLFIRKRLDPDHFIDY